MPRDSLKRSNNQPSPASLAQEKRQELLKQEWGKWEAFNRLSGNPDYQSYLKPLLESIRNKWPDPAQEGFDRKYIIEFARAQAYLEIYNLMETSGKMIENIRKQMEEPEKNYAI